MAIDPRLLAKFKRRAPLIVTQDHLDKAMFLFAPEDHDEVASQIQPLLKAELIARKVDALPEIKFKDPANPGLHELTVQRLNNLIAENGKLTDTVQAHEVAIANLEAERDSLQSEVALQKQLPTNTKV